MKRMLSIALLIAGSALLAGCPKKHNVNDMPIAGAQIPETAGANSNSAGEGASTSVSPLGSDAAAIARGLNDQTGPNARKIIYFDFDKSEIKPEFADIVTTAAHNLTSNPGVKIKLEGNTDARGTREYNIGLGERRAQAVRRALMLQGRVGVAGEYGEFWRRAACRRRRR